jgi:hypothetical protein
MGGSGGVDGVFNLTEEKFDRLVRVIVGLHLFAVGKEVGDGDVSVCDIKIVEIIVCAAVLIATIFLERRERRNMELTAPTICCLRSLSAVSYCRKRVVALSWARLVLVMAKTELPAGMVAVSPGFVGATKGVANSVL